MDLISTIQNAFFGGFTTGIDVKTIIVSVLLTTLISMYIFVVYRIMNRNMFYNKNFNISIVVTAVIIAAIILTIQTNIVISLGMVGALSIVRFRTAIKDPLDLVFIFWAIGVGIICGAGYAVIAVAASVIVTLILLLLNHIPVAKSPMILVITATDIDAEKSIMNIVGEKCSIYKVKSRNLRKAHLEMAIEVQTGEEAELVHSLVEIDSVISASLVSHEGEVTF